MGVPAFSFRGCNASFLYQNIVWMKSFQLPTAQLTIRIGTITKCFNGIFYTLIAVGICNSFGFLETSWLPSLGPSVSFSYGSQQRPLVSCFGFLVPPFLRCPPEVSTMRKPTLVWTVLKECKPLTTGCEYPWNDTDPMQKGKHYHKSQTYSPVKCQNHIKITSTGRCSSNLPQQSHQLHNVPSTLLLPD